MSSPAVRFAPRRWRRWLGFSIFAVLLAPTVILAIESATTGRAAPATLYVAAIAPIVGALYLRNLTRSIRVVPGVEIRWWGPFFTRHRLPIDDSTVIEWFSFVDGSLFPIRAVRTPIGTIDSRWATITSTGSRVLRLSMRYWRETSLHELASATSARLVIHTEPEDPVELAAKVPHLYTWLEKHPRLFQAIFVVIVLLAAYTIIIDLGLLITGFH